jgi:hypothetical protein
MCGKLCPLAHMRMLPFAELRALFSFWLDLTFCC